MQGHKRQNVALLAGCLFSLAATGCGTFFISSLPPDTADLGNRESQTDQSDPAIAAARTLSGVWEVLADGDPQGDWQDESAPMALLLEAAGNPFAQASLIREGERFFAIFDSNDVMVAAFGYDAAANTLNVESLPDYTCLGRRAESQEDYSLLLQGPILAQQYGAIEMSGSVEVSFYPPDSGETAWSLVVVSTFATTALQDIPADPVGGTPAVSAGDQAIFESTSDYILSPSAGPAELFPDAVWRIRPSDE